MADAAETRPQRDQPVRRHGPAGRGRKRLEKRGKLKARLKVEYSPVGGDVNTQRQTVTLHKKPS